MAALIIRVLMRCEAILSTMERYSLGRRIARFVVHVYADLLTVLVLATLLVLLLLLLAAAPARAYLSSLD